MESLAVTYRRLNEAADCITQTVVTARLEKLPVLPA